MEAETAPATGLRAEVPLEHARRGRRIHAAAVVGDPQPHQAASAGPAVVGGLEAQILEKVQKLKANTRSCICEHFSLEGPDPGPYDSSVNYYDKFWKRFMLNEIGKQNILQFRS